MLSPAAANAAPPAPPLSSPSHAERLAACRGYAFRQHSAGAVRAIRDYIATGVTSAALPARYLPERPTRRDTRARSGRLVDLAHAIANAEQRAATEAGADDVL